MPALETPIIFGEINHTALRRGVLLIAFPDCQSMQVPHDSVMVKYSDVQTLLAISLCLLSQCKWGWPATAACSAQRHEWCCPRHQQGASLANSSRWQQRVHTECSSCKEVTQQMAQASLASSLEAVQSHFWSSRVRLLHTWLPCMPVLHAPTSCKHSSFACIDTMFWSAPLRGGGGPVVACYEQAWKCLVSCCMMCIAVSSKQQHVQPLTKLLCTHWPCSCHMHFGLQHLLFAKSCCHGTRQAA